MVISWIKYFGIQQYCLFILIQIAFLILAKRIVVIMTVEERESFNLTIPNKNDTRKLCCYGVIIYLARSNNTRRMSKIICQSFAKTV